MKDGKETKKVEIPVRDVPEFQFDFNVYVANDGNVDIFYNVSTYLLFTVLDVSKS